MYQQQSSYDAFWDLTSKRRNELQQKATELFFHERLYRDRDRGAFDGRAWKAYGKSWDDWFHAAGMDMSREWKMASNSISRFFGNGDQYDIMPDRDTMDAIGASILSPNTRFVNTRAAQTMRQATLSAMHNSVYSLRGALGNEASMMHR